jgi:hypothetical protein
MTRSAISARTRLAVGVGLVVFLVLIGSGAAQATWTALSSALSAKVSTGQPSVAFGDAGTLNRTYGFTTGSTSTINIQSVTISDNGTTPFTSYALTSTTSNATYGQKILLWIWSPTTTGCGSTVSGTPGTLAVPPTLPAAASVGGAVSSVLTLCMATQLNTSVILTAGQTVTTALTITGRIGTNWQAVSTSSITQSSVLPDPVVTCQTVGILPPLLLDGAQITVTLPTGASGYTVYNGTTVVGGVKNITTNPIILGTTQYGTGSATSVRIVAVYNSTVESPGTTQALVPAVLTIGTSCG